MRGLVRWRVRGLVRGRGGAARGARARDERERGEEGEGAGEVGARVRV